MTVAEPEGELKSAQIGLFRQLFRFVAIGGGCAVVDYGAYMLLLGFDWTNWIARSFAFILGTTCSYFINRKLTFSGARTGNTKAKAGGFALVYLVTYFVNIGTNQILVTLTPDSPFGLSSEMKYTLCWVLGQGLGTLINFVMLKWVVFRK